MEAGTSKDIGKHKRINDILLGPLERPALQWFASNLPSWVTPDFLTGVGLAGTLMIFFGYWLTDRHLGFLWLASLGFFVNWWGDSLDGTVARHRKIERPKYGFYVDHIVDSISQFVLLLGLGLSSLVRLELALLASIGYLLMSVYVYIRTAVVGEFKISYGKLGPTEIRAMAVIVNTIVFFISNPQINFPFGTMTVYEIFISLITIALFLMFLYSAIKGALELVDADKPN